jgi:hypothetical protein
MAECCCPSGECCGTPQPKKPIAIDFLYLDTTVCGRCQDTEAALDEAVSSVAAVLDAAGYAVAVDKVNIATREQAIRHRFVSSPTIRVNGNDIAVELKESLCEDCGALCGDAVECRVWVYNGVEYSAPPKALIVDAILRAVYSPGQGKPERESYRLPANLRTYFAAKARKDEAEHQEKGLSAMKKMKIFEPAMCCPTGLCGMVVDPELLRLSAVLDALNKCGVEVDRFNLSGAPVEFVADPVINAYITAKGPEGLPAVMVDGEIVIEGRYPTNEEFTALLDLSADLLGKPAEKEKGNGGCRCKGSCC